MSEPHVNTESSDYKYMKVYWNTITDIQEGARAVKAKGKEYLPKYEKESDESYALRLKMAPWRPEFVDALQSLVAKPFAKEITLQGNQYSQKLRSIAEDVDGQGNNMHVFARNTFRDGIAQGLAGIYIAFPSVEPTHTFADEKRVGARPYWVPIKAVNVIACYTKLSLAGEIIEHIRFRDTFMERKGFGEVERECIRVLELDVNGLPTSTLYQKDEKQLNATIADALTGEKGEKWSIVEGPTILKGVTSVPVVLFFTGERLGHYSVKPPLADLAEMQLELYRGGSRKEEILTYAGSPMLVASGMGGPDTKYNRAGSPEKPIPIVVGPKTILFAPPVRDGVQSSWNFIQPNAANITEIRLDLEVVVNDFRRLAMQPTTSLSGRLTATGAAIEGAKAHSALQMWAMTFKDMLEEVWMYTAEWMNEASEVEVFVHTDFGVDLNSNDEGELLKLRLAGEISRQTLWDELLRRSFLGPQFNADDEINRIEEEGIALAVNDPNLGNDPNVVIDPTLPLNNPTPPLPTPPQKVNP